MKLFELFDRANNGDYAWEPTNLQIEETLIKECSEFFRQSGELNDHNQIWRGLHLEKKTFQKLDRQHDRESLNTPNEAHKIINEYFNDKFRWKARSGVFGVGSKSEASFYGHAYAMFPIGKFNFVWSPEVEDLTMHLRNDFSDEDEEVFDDEEREALKERLRSQLDRVKWKTTDLEGAIKSRHEIMIDCDSYFILDADKVDEIDWQFIFDSV